MAEKQLTYDDLAKQCGIEQATSLSEFIALVDDAVQTKKKGVENGDDRVRVMNLWAISEPGIGKTQRLQQYAKDNGIAYSYICGSNVFQGDLSGIPVVINPKDSSVPEIVKAMINGYFPHVPQNEKEMNDKSLPYNQVGFLFVDELMNMDPLVRGELLQYVDGNDKGTGLPNFPAKWFMIAASNTEETVGDNFQDLSANIRAKFEEYYVYPDFDDYLTYMQKYYSKAYNRRGYHSAIMSYLTENKMDLAPHFNPNETRNIASPRNWEAMNIALFSMEDRIASGYTDIKSLKERFEKKAVAVLGKEIGNKFIDHYHFEKDTIDPKDYLEKNLSSDSKWGSFDKKGLQLKLLSVYRALDLFSTKMNDGKKVEDKKFKEMLKNFQDNSAWLIKDRAEDFLVGILDSLVNRIDRVDDPALLTKEFQKLAEKSILFNKA